MARHAGTHDDTPPTSGLRNNRPDQQHPSSSPVLPSPPQSSYTLSTLWTFELRAPCTHWHPLQTSLGHLTPSVTHTHVPAPQARVRCKGLLGCCARLQCKRYTAVSPHQLASLSAVTLPHPQARVCCQGLLACCARHRSFSANGTQQHHHTISRPLTPLRSRTPRHAFAADSLLSLVYQIVRGNFPPIPTDQFTSGLSDLVNRLLARDAAARPSLGEVRTGNAIGFGAVLCGVPEVGQTGPGEPPAGAGCDGAAAPWGGEDRVPALH